VKHSNRNFAVAYIFLVALPVLGLAGVLRSQRNLKAPIAIGGTWKVQVNADQLAAIPCGKSLAANPAFSISQSGTTFTLSCVGSPWMSMMGTLGGTAIQASVVPSPAVMKDGGCRAEQTLSLTAGVDSQSSPKRMAGVFRVKDCAGCVPAEFHALQEDQTKGAR